VRSSLRSLCLLLIVVDKRLRKFATGNNRKTMSTSPFFTQGFTPRRPGDHRQSTPPRDAAIDPTTALTILDEHQPRGRPGDDTPPNTDTRKRAYIDTSIATPGEKLQLSPLKAAEEFIVSHTASLRNEIATLLLDRGREHIHLAHKAYSKYQNQSRMENDDDYIPVSARVEFRLQAVKEAEELPEFQQLQDQAVAVIKEKQIALKKLVIATIKLEQKVLQEKLNKHFCDSIFMATKLFLTAQGVDTAQSHNTVGLLLEQHWETLLKFTGCNVEAFAALYKATLQVGVQPPVSADAHNSQHIGCIKRAIESVFVLSWDRYLRQVHENELSISLKKEMKEQLLWRKTEAATLEIDNELPADREQLRDLIRREAEIMTKKYISKAAAAKLDTAKNTKRGRAVKGASNKKKNDSNNKEKAKDTKEKDANDRDKKKTANMKTQASKQNRNPRRSRSRTRHNDRKAGDADNDSERGASHSRRKRSKSKQQNLTRASSKGRQRS
jgi:hypothetical protein